MRRRTKTIWTYRNANEKTPIRTALAKHFYLPFYCCARKPDWEIEHNPLVPVGSRGMNKEDYRNWMEIPECFLDAARFCFSAVRNRDTEFQFNRNKRGRIFAPLSYAYGYLEWFSDTQLLRVVFTELHREGFDPNRYEAENLENAFYSSAMIEIPKEDVGPPYINQSMNFDLLKSPEMSHSGICETLFPKCDTHEARMITPSRFERKEAR